MTTLAQSITIRRWLKRSTINYTDYYLRLYIAFNAWYQNYSRTTNDRQALQFLKAKRPFWQSYCSGTSLFALGIPMMHVVELTQREPYFAASSHWKGYVENIYDWPGILEFWYQVRCYIVHGSIVPEAYVQLAYQSLYVFMQEVVFTQTE